MKIFNKIFLALILSAPLFAQNVSLNDTVHLVYGALTYNGQTIFITDSGLTVSSNGNYYNDAYSQRKSTNEQFSEYYKMIYGKDAKNPNYVIDGENMGFVPFLNLNELYGINKPLVNGVSISDFAKAATDKNYPNRNEIIGKVKNYLERNGKR